MSLIDRLWYQSTPWLLPLWPLEKLFTSQAANRRRKNQAYAQQIELPAPVIIVGNISVGGVGKTPLVVWLIETLKQQGHRPGVVSRGYGAKAPQYPMQVDANSDPRHCGDEPLMIAQRCGCPVVVDPDRVSAAEYLCREFDIDVIISDDGLQHYRLPRDIEIAVVDGERGLGNGHCLPVGPLRESEQRLQEVDFCIVNGGSWSIPDSIPMTLKSGDFHQLNGGKVELSPQPVNGVAGIGNPPRFFASLTKLGFQVSEHPFSDHHQFQASDLSFDNDYVTVMTEKDAVKCRALAADNRYYLSVSAVLPESFKQQLLGLLEQLNRNI
ncbi:MAG: tetraacyldisaccharide 4'-kinase [Motiliproteus sp.]|nr:tetraacyldisaccharide 4'-kinase [Motiliproteus sp.]MCW9051802.1 tetraacyldisaccharide 4'-kinase [Motiliproteus sp.]